MEPNDPVNRYAPPRAELDVVRTYMQTASLENAMEGNYDFQIGEVMAEAWRLVKGIKASFWGAAAVIGVIYLVLNTISLFPLVLIAGAEPGRLALSIFNAIMGVLMTPFTMGLYMMGVRRALGVPVSFSTAFSYLSRSGTAIAATLLITLLSALGMALLVVGFFYLAVGYHLSIQLVCDQELSAWRAMETSRRAIRHKWSRVFGLILAVLGLTFLSALLIVPLIWTLPWACTVSGVLYRRIFFAAPPAQATPPSPVTPEGPPPV